MATTTTPDTKKAFWEAKNTSFSEPTPDDEMLHRDAPQERAQRGADGDAVPRVQHPRGGDSRPLLHLASREPRMVTGGAWAWQGVEEASPPCELFDMRAFIDDECLSGDLHDVELPNGYRSKVVEPLKEFEIQYSDPSRQNSFEVSYEAIMPPMMLSTGMHLEQAVKTHGTVDPPREGVRGATDTRSAIAPGARFAARLRLAAPPIAWMTSVFGDDFAFGTTAFDSEDTDPEWKGVLEIPGGDPVRGGWVYRDGEIVPVVSATKRTRHDVDSLFPESVEMTITDANGRDYELTGTVLAAAPWSTWPNIDSVICLARWECDGRVGHGDIQEVQFTDYKHGFLGSSG